MSRANERRRAGGIPVVGPACVSLGRERWVVYRIFGGSHSLAFKFTGALLPSLHMAAVLLALIVLITAVITGAHLHLKVLNLHCFIKR